MAPPRYTITPTDAAHARAYLTLQLQTYSLRLRQYSYQEATVEFERPPGKTKDERAGFLNAWCEKFLSGQEWAKLKAAIRKRRQRRKMQHKVVTISATALDLLQRLSKRDQATHSETLEHYLRLALRGKSRARN